MWEHWFTLEGLQFWHMLHQSPRHVVPQQAERHYKAIEGRSRTLAWGPSIIVLEGRKHGVKGVPLSHREADVDPPLPQEVASLLP